jgi:hypothetical protein
VDSFCGATAIGTAPWSRIDSMDSPRVLAASDRCDPASARVERQVVGENLAHATLQLELFPALVSFHTPPMASEVTLSLEFALGSACTGSIGYSRHPDRSHRNRSVYRPWLLGFLGKTPTIFPVASIKRKVSGSCPGWRRATSCARSLAAETASAALGKTEVSLSTRMPFLS